MRDFIKSGGTLGRLDPGVKLVYTAFLSFTLLGIVTITLLHVDSMGLSTESARAYWAGDEVAAYPKSFRQLLELTHFHLFTEPVTWLILAHLYHLGGDPLRRRIGGSVIGVVAIAMQISLPWAVTYGPGWLAMALAPCHGLVALSLAYMAGAAIRDMWWARREA